jgi:enoyl-[acyl-carrier protein] reductase II
MPVRLLKNKFSDEIRKLEENGTEAGILKEILGTGRAKLGMFEGNTDEGELEIGQVSGFIRNILPAGEIIKEIIYEYNQALSELHPLSV